MRGRLNWTGGYWPFFFVFFGKDWSGRMALSCFARRGLMDGYLIGNTGELARLLSCYTSLLAAPHKHLSFCLSMSRDRVPLALVLIRRLKSASP